MRRFSDLRFQPLCDALPARVRKQAVNSFALIEQEPKHPSLHVKCITATCGQRGLGHRALGVEGADGFHWFWIGSHSDYDRLMG